MYLAAFLFLQFPAWDGYGVGDMDPALLALTVIGCTLFPIIGNNRPDWVSFLPSMRQYAGNWASALWAFAPGRGAQARRASRQARHDAEAAAHRHVRRGGGRAGPAARRRAGARCTAWAAACNSVLMNLLDDDIDTYYLREAEFAVQLHRRLQLRRRAPARLAADRGDPEALQLRARRVHRGVGRVASRSSATSSSTGSWTRPSASSSAASWKVTDAVARAAVAAERADPPST